eukprot:TRINITY_DN60781_c0_g1_i1.p1 TRINITY_DN60781_c0_g1~~TRINITY_DN60781_c0_g1_i1.p1  ORF type:complete len:271 (+),score=33.28 TRINITY_DN60781_c0_g1_i1:114-926(+)
MSVESISWPMLKSERPMSFTKKHTDKRTYGGVQTSSMSILDFPNGISIGKDVLYWDRCVAIDRVQDWSESVDETLAEGEIRSADTDSITIEWVSIVELPDGSSSWKKSSQTSVVSLGEEHEIRIGSWIRSPGNMLAISVSQQAWDRLRSTMLVVSLASAQLTSDLKNAVVSLVALSGEAFEVQVNQDASIAEVIVEVRRARGLSSETAIRIVSADGRILPDRQSLRSLHAVESLSPQADASRGRNSAAVSRCTEPVAMLQRAVSTSLDPH